MALGALFWIGAGLAAAGAGASYAGAQQSKQAMERTMAAEIARQRRYQQESGEIVNKRIAESGSDTAQLEMRSGALKRQAAFEQAQQQPLHGPDQFAVDAERPTTVDVGNRLRTQSENIQQAALGGYTEWELQQLIKQMRASQKAGLIGSIARDSSSVLPIELQAASRKGDTLQGLGQLLGVAGSLTGLAGALYQPAAAASTVARGAAQTAYTPAYMKGLSLLPAGMGSLYTGSYGTPYR